MPTLLILSDDPAIVSCARSMDSLIMYRPDQIVDAADVKGSWKMSGNTGTLIIFAHGKMADPAGEFEAFVGDAAGPHPKAGDPKFTAAELAEILQKRMPPSGRIYVQACQSADVINPGDLPPTAHERTLPDSFAGKLQQLMGDTIVVKGRHGSPTTENFSPLPIASQQTEESALWKKRVFEDVASMDIEDEKLAGSFPELKESDLTLPPSAGQLNTNDNSDAPGSHANGLGNQPESKDNLDSPGTGLDSPGSDGGHEIAGGPGI